MLKITQAAQPSGVAVFQRSAGDDGTVRTWDAATGAEVSALRLGEPAYDIDWTPDGMVLMIAGRPVGTSDLAVEASGNEFGPSVRYIQRYIHWDGM